MFSKAAANALLKTLEEPPENVMFILCTTEPERLPQTIRSRCLRFEFRRVRAEEIKEGMARILSRLEIEADEDALYLLANLADGSVRDGLSLLDQCVGAAEGKITREFVLELTGSPKGEQIAGLTSDVFAGDASAALVRLNDLLAEGKEELRVIEEWIEWLHAALLSKVVEDPSRILNRSAEHIDEIKQMAAGLDTHRVTQSIYRLSRLLRDAKNSPNARILLEMAIIELSNGKDE
jgi:DNA polymerase-3 subunit gamma/tau